VGLQKLDYPVKADTGIVAMSGAGMATMRVTSLPNVVSRDNGNRVTFHPLRDKPDYRGRLASDIWNRSLAASLNFCLHPM
jgi:hypothetical protein